MKRKASINENNNQKNKNNLHEKSIHSTTYFQKGADSIEIQKKNTNSKIKTEEVNYLRFQRRYER